MGFGTWTRDNIYYILAVINLLIAILWAASVTAINRVSPEGLTTEEQQEFRQKAEKVYVGTHGSMIALLFVNVVALFISGLTGNGVIS